MDQDQRHALEAAETWMAASPRHPFILNGWAGTGKTTLARKLAEKASNPTFLAPTGKAAHVLSSKGCPAQTIHSAIYLVGGQRKEAKERIRAAIATTTDPSTLAKLRAKLATLNSPRWVKRDELRFNTDLIIVDEVSMVTATMMADLLSFGVPVMGLGDPGQLPPVSGKPQPYPATATLTQIRRTDTPELLDLATAARTRASITRWNGVAGYRDYVSLATIARSGQVLCGTNATRWDLNKRIRRHVHGSSYSALPRQGDKIMALVNNGNAGVVNGQIEVVDKVSQEEEILTVVTTSGAAWSVPTDGFRSHEDEQDALEAYRRDETIIPATWAWAITTHKAQGSQWGSVVVIDESHVFRDQRDKWLYTAVTRAQKQCLVVAKGVK